MSHGGQQQIPTEREVQRAILAMVEKHFPRVLCHHSPNAIARRGRGGSVAGYINKTNGTKAGWPDLIFVAPQFLAFGEVKRPKRSTTSEAQKDMLDTLAAMGHHTSILRSAEQAYTWLREIGAPWNGVEFVPDRLAA